MSKPQRILLSYIQVRGPALAAIYDVIKNSANSGFSNLRELFCMPEKNTSKLQIGQLRGCLNFLRTIDLVEAESMSGEETYRINADLQSMPFYAVLLHKLRLAKDASFYKVQKVLARNDISFINMKRLRRLVEDSLDLGFAWTSEKLNFWMELADFLRLGIKTSSRSFIFYPSPELIYAVLESFAKDHGQIHLNMFVEYLRSNFFECLTKEGHFQLFKGLQQTLLLLEEHERIEFISMSDDPRMVKVGNESVSLISVKGG